MNNDKIPQIHPIAEDNDILIKKAIDSKTSQEDFASLSLSDNETVRAAVAMNEATPRAVLDALSRDSSAWVKSCLDRRAEQDSAVLSIHPTAIIHGGAQLGENCIVGPYTIIHKNVIIDANAVIGSHCELGHPAHSSNDREPLIIGKNSHIRSHSIFYEGSTFGENLVTGHRVTVRERTLAGRNFQIGTLSDIQGHCEIGDFVRFHSNVHIGQHSKIANYVWIFPYVVLTNDPHPPSEVMMGVTIEDYVAIATMSIILPGVIVGNGALVGAHSSVSRNVEDNTVVAGSPAKFVCETSKIKLKDGTDMSAYPWRRHFHRGYLPDTVLQWMSEFSKEEK